MSVRVMSAIWELPMLPTDKLVMLALADCANDEGHCWPSIATVARKSGASERSVQRAIRRAEEAGLLHREEVIGKGCKYNIDPRHCVTPVKVSPPPQCHPTPDTVSPKPSRTIKSSSVAKATSLREAFPMPVGTDPQCWRDFLENRKRKRLGNTATAHRKLLADLARLSDDEWPPPRLIEHAAAHGWGGIYDPREQRNGHMGRHQSANGISATVAAAIDVFGLPDASDERRVPQRVDQVPRLGGPDGHG